MIRNTRGIIFGIFLCLLIGTGIVFTALSTYSLINGGTILPNAYAMVYNVKNQPYNAQGDGSTDDTTAINMAINDAVNNPPSVLKFPPGTYIVTSQLTISGSTDLTVSGPGTIKLISMTAANVIRFTSATRLTINGSLNVTGWQDGTKMQSYSDGTLKVGGGISVDSNSNNVTIKDCIVSNTNLYGITIKDSSNASVSNCQVANARTSIRFNNVTTGVISNNNLHDQRADGIYLESGTTVSNVNITGNTITTFGDTAIDVSSNGNNIRVTNNTVTTAYSVVDQNIAFATYKSGDEANGLKSPKYREWNLTSSQWGSQTELQAADGTNNIRDLKIYASPTTSERAIIAKVEGAGGLYLYTCFASCTESTKWTKNTITLNANIWNTNQPYRDFAAAYEQQSGKLLIAYDKTANNTDVWYKIWSNGALGGEQSGPNFITDNNVEIRQIELASSPTTNKIAMVLEDATNRHVRAFMWDGDLSAWDSSGSGKEITTTLGSTSIGGLPVAVAFQSNGNAVAFSGDGSDSIKSCLWTAPSGPWCTTPSKSDPNQAQWNNVMFLSAKRNPTALSNQIVLCQVDNQTDLNCTRYANGANSAWSNVLDSNVDPSNSNVHAFEWDAAGSNKGLLAYGTTLGKLTYRLYDGASFGSAAEITSGNGNTHPWFAMVGNPVTSDKTKVLGMFQTNSSPFDIGAFNWTGGADPPIWISDSQFTSDMGTTNGVQAFDLVFENSNMFASDPTGIDPNGLAVNIGQGVSVFTISSNTITDASNGMEIDGDNGTIQNNTISYRGIRAEYTKLLVQGRYVLASCFTGIDCFDQFGIKSGGASNNTSYSDNKITSPNKISKPLRWDLSANKIIRNVGMNIGAKYATIDPNNTLKLYTNHIPYGLSANSTSIYNYGIRLGAPGDNIKINYNTVTVFAGGDYKSLLEKTLSVTNSSESNNTLTANIQGYGHADDLKKNFP
jgi:parallel beta-helix repeat protein